MVTIKEYNQNLNKSYDPYENYLRWESYRKKITDFIIKDHSEYQSILVIGAGYLNDLDMSRIISSSKQVSLLDIDTTSIEKGLEIQSLKKEMVNIIEKDITSLDIGLFFEKIIYILQAKDFEGLKRYLHEEGENIRRIDLEKKYDLVIVSPIYTQLLLPQYLDIMYQILDPKEVEKAMEPFMYFISKVIRNVNDVILELSKSDVVVISDILEYQGNDERIKQIKERIDDNFYIEKILDNYTNEYGEGLGSFGIKDISNKTNITKEKWLLWDFSEDRKLLTKIIQCRKL